MEQADESNSNGANDASPVRRSKRKKYTRYQCSVLQHKLVVATGQPGGTTKILRLVQNASDREIQELNDVAQWTPLVGAIFRLGKNTTKKGNSEKSEEELVRMIRAFHDRGVSLNSGAWFANYYQRPLVVAAYYGFYSAVRLMIELGALPDLGDGEGRNVWFAAFQNPAASGAFHNLRDCDRVTAQSLLDMDVVAKDLGAWRRSPQGSKCYMNVDSDIGSVMYNAIQSRNADVVKFFCKEGYRLTDRVYLMLGKRRLLRMVAEILARGENLAEGGAVTLNTTQLMRKARLWSQKTDWSFPPTWKVGVRLCSNCGLPPALFQQHVLPFLGRDWFYTSDDMLGRFGAVGPSMGERRTPHLGAKLWV